MTPEQIKAAFAERSRAAGELRGMYEAAGDKPLSAEDVAKEERLNEAIQTNDEIVRRGLSLIDSEKRAEEARAAVEGLEGATERKAHDPLAEERALLVKLANREINQAEFRDLTKGTATDGAELVKTSFYNQVVEHMVDSSPILSSGVTVIRTAKGEDLVIPKTTAYSSASLVAEGGSIGESDPQWDTVTLGAFKLAFSTQASTELVTDESFNLTGFLARQGGAALGRKADEYFASGSGSSQPAGIDTATLGVTLASASAITFDEVIDAIHSVIPAYRANGAFYLSDATVKLARKVKDSDGRYLWQPSTQVGQPDTLFGHRLYVEPNLADLDGTVNAVVGVFGDPSGFFVRLTGGVEVAVSEHVGFLNGLVTWRFVVRIDSDIVDTNALRRIQAAAA